MAGLAPGSCPFFPVRTRGSALPLLAAAELKLKAHPPPPHLLTELRSLGRLLQAGGACLHPRLAASSRSLGNLQDLFQLDFFRVLLLQACKDDLPRLLRRLRLRLRPIEPGTLWAKLWTRGIARASLSEPQISKSRCKYHYREGMQSN